MTAGPPNLDFANRLLEELRAEPVGWPSLDLDRILTLWGFAEERLRTRQGWEIPLKYYPDYPDLNVTLFPSDHVHVEVALHVIRIIDTLKTRLNLP